MGIAEASRSCYIIDALVSPEAGEGPEWHGPVMSILDYCYGLD